MSAKHGLGALFGTRTRVAGLCATFALSMCAVAFAPAANAQNVKPKGENLALGDSISFGYTKEKFDENYPNESPSFFEGGFVNGFNKDLNSSKEIGKTVVDINAACPGETSYGLIGENPALGGKESTEPEGGSEGIQGPNDYHPCAYHYLDGFPLHYSLTPEGKHLSQLEEALSILKEGNPAHPVDAITLNIGSNDELASIARCKKTVIEEYETTGKSKYGGSTPEESIFDCIGHEATSPGGTIEKMIDNIADILGVLDSKEAGGGHYGGRIVLEGFYNPDAFVLPGSDTLQAGVNEALKEKVLPHFPNVTLANPFPVFNKDAFHEGNAKDEEKEQEAICKYTEMCNPNVQEENGKPAGKDGDIHPSEAGYKELATLTNKAWEANPAPAEPPAGEGG